MNPTPWAALTQTERHRTRSAMLAHGGGFVRAIAQALALADPAHQHRLTGAFPELAERYGPGSAPYQQTTGESA